MQKSARVAHKLDLKPLFELHSRGTLINHFVHQIFSIAHKLIIDVFHPLKNLLISKTFKNDFAAQKAHFFLVRLLDR